MYAIIPHWPLWDVICILEIQHSYAIFHFCKSFMLNKFCQSLSLPMIPVDDVHSMISKIYVNFWQFYSCLMWMSWVCSSLIWTIYDQLTSLMWIVQFRLSVCPSVTPFWLCSHHRIIMKFSGVITLDQGKVHAKGQGQRSKVKVTEVTTQIFVSGL